MDVCASEDQTMAEAADAMEPQFLSGASVDAETRDIQTKIPEHIHGL